MATLFPGQAFRDLCGKGVGTFSLDPATGRVTFTPNKSFVGTVDPVNLQVNDNGNEHRATYQPTVTELYQQVRTQASEGIQGLSNLAI